MPNHKDDQFPLVAIPTRMFRALERQLSQESNHVLRFQSVNQYVQDALASIHTDAALPILRDDGYWIGSFSQSGHDMYHSEDKKLVRVTAEQMNVLQRVQSIWKERGYRVQLSQLVAGMLYVMLPEIREAYDKKEGSSTNPDVVRPEFYDLFANGLCRIRPFLYVPDQDMWEGLDDDGNTVEAE